GPAGGISQAERRRAEGPGGRGGQEAGGDQEAGPDPERGAGEVPGRRAGEAGRRGDGHAGRGDHQDDPRPGVAGGPQVRVVAWIVGESWSSRTTRPSGAAWSMP